MKVIREDEDSGKLNAILSYDEKPGIQAIGNIYPDKQPDEDHGYVSRNHDCRRNGTLSLLAGIDLITGQIIPLVEEGYRSLEFENGLIRREREYYDDALWLESEGKS